MPSLFLLQVKLVHSFLAIRPCLSLLFSFLSFSRQTRSLPFPKNEAYCVYSFLAGERHPAGLGALRFLQAHCRR